MITNVPKDRSDDSGQYDVILEDVETGIRPRKLKPGEVKKSDRPPVGWQFASVAGEVGFDIALPMVLGLVVGARLDQQWGTRPKLTLSLFFFGLLLSCASLIRIVRDSLKAR